MPNKPWPKYKEEAFRMTANRDGICAECEQDIKEGDRIVYDPRHGKAYCEECGKDIIDG